MGAPPTPRARSTVFCFYSDLTMSGTVPVLASLDPKGGELGIGGRGPLVGPISDPPSLWGTPTLPCPTDTVPV